MTITSLGSTAGSPIKPKEADAVSATEKKEPIQSQLKSSMNKQIVQASLSVSLTAGENPQGLLFRSALESIYEAMGGSKFESKIMPDYQMPVATESDNPYATPEGTAEVILGFSLGLFASFSSQYPGKSEADVAEKFIKTIRGGFEDGYGKAVDILKAVGVFEGDLKADIEKTYELVMKGYDDFLASKKPVAEPAVES